MYDENVVMYLSCYSLCANPLARSPGQVKLDSDKWKYERICL